MNRSVLLPMALLLFAGLVPAQANPCLYTINSASPHVIFYNSSCQATALAFTNASNVKFYCNNNAISNVTFGQNTLNNTLYNCTFLNSAITSIGNASNNLISPYGNYSLKFIGNASNVAIGYYFNFVSLDNFGNRAPVAYIGLLPYAIAQVNIAQASQQYLNIADVYAMQRNSSILLPRFGIATPTGVGNLTSSFILEQKQVYNNHTLNFNPYFLVVPFWGHDILSFKIFNITHNMNFTPSFIMPDMVENIQYPDNTNLYWNYTVVRYSNASNMSLNIWNSYQCSSTGKIVKTYQNVTNGTISFDVGKQALGIHETIGVLKSANAMEQDNSTTETYSVGLSFCTEDMPPIQYPGYYSMAYSSLTKLISFMPSNELCNTALEIQSPNVTINCRGGAIAGTNKSIIAYSSNNLTIENCHIYGNAITLYNSNSVKIKNSSLVSASYSDIAINAFSSSLSLSNVSISGYANEINASNSEVIGNSIPHARNLTSTVSSLSLFSSTYTTTIHIPFFCILALMVATLLIAFIIYVIISHFIL